MNYIKTTLKEELIVKKIVTVHYFEYAKDYLFEGEKHDFWEFLYVDKGEVEVMADACGYKLKQGEMIFHKPNEFHNVWANGKVAPNLIVISFECKSKKMDYFKGKILLLENQERNLLAQIIQESREAFLSPLDDPTLERLEKRPKPRLGSEHLIKINLEQMLINLIRKGESIHKEKKLSSSVKERSDGDMVKKAIAYLEENVCHHITFEDVCRYLSLSRTSLKVMFKETTNSSVMEYYNKLKIAEAKRMIREGMNNFTKIADSLGYASIHYFSRHFKKATGMTPSEYALSVKIKL